MEGGDRGGRDKIAAPNERGWPSADINRPHLIESQARVIAAARVEQRVGSLESSVCPGATIGSAEGEHALLVRRQQFPKQFAPAAEDTGEPTANFIIGAEQGVEFFGRPDALGGVTVG